MKNTDTITVFTPVIRFFERYHLTIFIVVLVTGLVTAVLLLNDILQTASTTTTYTTTSTDITSFDQATIDRIEHLKTSSDTPADFTLPSGRTSPFSE